MTAEAIREPRYRYTCDTCTVSTETDGSQPTGWSRANVSIGGVYRTDGLKTLDYCPGCADRVVSALGLDDLEKVA